MVLGLFRSAVDDLLVCFCWDKIFAFHQWLLPLLNNGEIRVSGLDGGCFGIKGCFGNCAAIVAIVEKSIPCQKGLVGTRSAGCVCLDDFFGGLIIFAIVHLACKS